MDKETSKLITQLSQMNKDLRRLELEIIKLEGTLIKNIALKNTLQEKIKDINKRIKGLK